MGELDGIDPSLHAAYRLCRTLNARHGKTYFLATRLLPTSRRAGVHALYGFARMVDDVVDVGADSGIAPTDRAAAAALDELEARVRTVLAGGVSGHAETDLVLSALADTTARYDIPHEYHYAFLHSMRMDIPGTAAFRSRYRTMAELSEYMYGSAAVIGLQMLPILGTSVPIDDAVGPARALGEAFQLTNFIRDMGEDLDRDRIYLPTDELAAFGVDEELLRRCRSTGRTDPRLGRALAHLVAHTGRCTGPPNRGSTCSIPRRGRRSAPHSSSTPTSCAKWRTVDTACSASERSSPGVADWLSRCRSC